MSNKQPKAYKGGCVDLSATEWLAANYPATPSSSQPAPEWKSALNGSHVGELASCKDGALYLWLVERVGGGGYDETTSIVVIAAGEEDARDLFPDKYAGIKTAVTRVGVALPGATAGTIVCHDFLEG